jgi:hypothetical protein
MSQPVLLAAASFFCALSSLAALLTTIRLCRIVSALLETKTPNFNVPDGHPFGGNHMVDKAGSSALIEPRQAGVDALLREVIAIEDAWDGVPGSLDLPPGLTVEMVDLAEDLILDWEGTAHYRAAPLVVVLFKMFAMVKVG